MSKAWNGVGGWHRRYRRSWGILGAAFVLCGSPLLPGCAPAVSVASDPLQVTRQRLAEAPNDVATYLHMAQLYMQQRDYVRSRQYLRLVERSQDGWETAGIDPERLFRLIVLNAVRSEQYSEAITHCEQRLQRGEDLGVRVLLALLLETKGDAEAAERQRQLILLQHPNDPRQLIELARFYERSMRAEWLPRARPLYRQYLQRAPEGPESAPARAAVQAADLGEKEESHVGP